MTKTPQIPTSDFGPWPSCWDASPSSSPSTRGKEKRRPLPGGSKAPRVKQLAELSSCGGTRHLLPCGIFRRRDVPAIRRMPCPPVVLPPVYIIGRAEGKD